MGVDVKIEGLEGILSRLREMPKKLRASVLRKSLAAGGRLVRDDARRRAPVLVNAAAAPYRTPGLVRRSIVVRTSKHARQAGDVGVFINVRPAKGAKVRTTTRRVLGLKLRTRTQVRATQRGAQSKLDPFYWRFLEFGTRKMPARPFLVPAAQKLPAALEVITRDLRRWVDRITPRGVPD